jgi:hypothetical protein
MKYAMPTITDTIAQHKWVRVIHGAKKHKLVKIPGTLSRFTKILDTGFAFISLFMLLRYHKETLWSARIKKFCKMVYGQYVFELLGQDSKHFSDMCLVAAD